MRQIVARDRKLDLTAANLSSDHYVVVGVHRLAERDG